MCRLLKTRRTRNILERSSKGTCWCSGIDCRIERDEATLKAGREEVTVAQLDEEDHVCMLHFLYCSLNVLFPIFRRIKEYATFCVPCHLQATEQLSAKQSMLSSATAVR